MGRGLFIKGQSTDRGSVKEKGMYSSLVSDAASNAVLFRQERRGRETRTLPPLVLLSFNLLLLLPHHLPPSSSFFLITFILPIIPSFLPLYLFYRQTKSGCSNSCSGSSLTLDLMFVCYFDRLSLSLSLATGMGISKSGGRQTRVGRK